MRLNIIYEWEAEGNRGKTEELDEALKNCLAEFGFKMTDAGYDLKNGERSLSFSTDEFISRPIDREGKRDLPEDPGPKYPLCMKCMEFHDPDEECYYPLP